MDSKYWSSIQLMFMEYQLKITSNIRTIHVVNLMYIMVQNGGLRVFFVFFYQKQVFI